MSSNEESLALTALIDTCFQDKTSISMGELGGFYLKFPKFRGLIRAESVERIGGHYGLSYNKKKNSIDLSKSNKCVAPSPVTAPEPDKYTDSETIVKKLVAYMKKNSISCLPMNELGALFPSYRGKFQDDVITYGLKHNIAIENQNIVNLTSSVSPSVPVSLPEAEAKEIVRKLAEVIQASGRREWHSGELVEFYALYPMYKSKFSMDLVLTYGKEYGLTFISHNIILSPKKFPFAATTTAPVSTTSNTLTSTLVTKSLPSVPLAPMVNETKPPASTSSMFTSNGGLPSNTERLMVKKLAEFMKSMNKEQLRNHEVAEFYKAYPQYSKLLKIAYVDKFGSEFGLKADAGCTIILKKPSQIITAKAVPAVTPPPTNNTTATATVTPATLHPSPVVSIGPPAAPSTSFPSLQGIYDTLINAMTSDSNSSDSSSNNDDGSAPILSAKITETIPIATPMTIDAPIIELDDRSTSDNATSSSTKSPTLETSTESYKVELVTDTIVAARIVKNILANHTKVALDMEMETVDNAISLIQIAIQLSSPASSKSPTKTTNTVQVYIFDILENNDLLFDGKVGELLTSEQIIKVIHDCRNDYECLFQEYGLCLQQCVDTQIAYTICKKKVSSYQVGMNRVLQEFATSMNTQKESIDHTQWSQRPLSPKQIQYAAEDVAYLLQAYESMLSSYGDSMENLQEYILTRSMERVVYADQQHSRKTSSELLAKYPLNTMRYFTFDVDGHVLLHPEPFASDELWAQSSMNTEEEAKQTMIRRAEKQLIVQLLPWRFQQSISRLGNMLDHATEIVLDLGRKVSLRLVLEIDDSFSSSSTKSSKKATNPSSKPPQQQPLKRTAMKSISYELPEECITLEDIAFIAKQLGEFTSDNRCGLSGTLHRISRKLNRSGDTIAYTIRLGHSMPGSTRMIHDLIMAKKSILLIGVPGVGKTTLLREIARILSTPSSTNPTPLRVEIIDTSNEIAGDGDIAHAAIGFARRMMVKDRKYQHEVMIETVQNHTPECILIDEIGTKKEARAASDITQRGVQLIGTVHGIELRQLIDNAELNGLIGGVHTIVVGDDEARRRKIRSKSVLERMGSCAFDCAIELRALDTWVIHHDLSAAVDGLLAEKPLPLEIRRYDRGTQQMVVEKVAEYSH